MTEGKPRINNLDVSDDRVIRRAEESHEFAVEWIKATLEDDASTVAALRAERDELAKENEGLRLTVKHCLNGQKWLRCEIEAIAEKAESTTGTRDGAYYRALIWIRERARAALNRGDTE